MGIKDSGVVNMVDFLSSVMSELNSNLAVERNTIEQMMESGCGKYKTKSGAEIEIPKEEIDIIWKICDDSERISLRLPIFVSTDVSSECNAWKVQGRPEAKVVSKLLGKSMFREDYIRLYNPDFSDLKKKIPNSIMVVFTP